MRRKQAVLRDGDHHGIVDEWNRPREAREALLAAAVICALGVGCGSETGILVAVSSNTRVDEIVFQVGVEQGDVFVLDEEASGERVDVRGRDLRARPYALLLKEPVAEGGRLRIRVLVLGERQGDGGSSELVAFGLMDPPQAFMRGDVLRRTVTLVSLQQGDNVDSSGGCFDARRGEQRVVLVAANNRDCDPVTIDAVPADCDDHDDAVYPGAAERCDGRDNNCDGSFGPSVGICYLRDPADSAVCFEGTRPCDGEGVGAGECARGGGNPVADSYCEAFPSCERFADPTDCIRGRIVGLELGCTLQRQEVGGACGGGSVLLEPLKQAEVCGWEIVEDPGYGLSFGDAGAMSSGSCQARLRVAAGLHPPPRGTAVIEFFAAGEPAGVAEVSIDLATVAACDPAPLSCGS